MVLGGYTGSNVATKAEEIPYTYSDIGFGFMPSKILTQQGVSGDILRVYDDNSIKQSLRNIVQTSKHERPFRPNFGVGTRKYLFENFDEFELYDFEISVRNQIEAYEPRVKLESVDAEVINDYLGGAAMQVTINFSYTPIDGGNAVSSEIRITTERVR